MHIFIEGFKGFTVTLFDKMLQQGDALEKLIKRP
jgi:hypothetical protein